MQRKMKKNVKKNATRKRKAEEANGYLPKRLKR
jgi:hypothetical protein